MFVHMTIYGETGNAAKKDLFPCEPSQLLCLAQTGMRVAAVCLIPSEFSNTLDWLIERHIALSQQSNQPK
jgi:hypothetical protein